MGSALGTTGSRGRKHALDKFYTKQEVAEYFTTQIPALNSYDTIIEPSAGGGAFMRALSTLGISADRVLAYDLSPEAENIVEADWLKVGKQQFAHKRTLVIGNPPFGTSGNLAMRFIKESSFADTIAFIIPRSFRKASVKNRVPAHFWLIYEEDTPRNSFTLNGKDYDVPCVFQIWERRKQSRNVNRGTVSSAYIAFTSKEDADFRIQRVGGSAGRASLDLDSSVSSNYFVKNTTTASTIDLVGIVNSIDFATRDYSTGPRSLSKGELVSELENALEERGIRPQELAV